MNRNEIKAYVLDSLAGRLTCREFVEMATDYLEGSLSLWNRIRFQLHLGFCLGCRIYLKQIRQTISALGRFPQEPVPPAIREALLRRFRTKI